VQDLQIMTDNLDDKKDEEIMRELNNICDECKKRGRERFTKFNFN